MNKSQKKYRKAISAKVTITVIILSLILIVLSLFQVSFFKVFGKVPALVLSFVCATGFVFGEKLGGVCGIVGGFFIDIVGSDGISFSPLIFMLAGYFCGYFLKIFLRKNFLSFLIYSSLTGLARACLTLGYFALNTAHFNIITIFTKTLLPEFFSFIIFAPLSYFICLGIEKITEKIKA